MPGSCGWAWQRGRLRGRARDRDVNPRRSAIDPWCAMVVVRGWGLGAFLPGLGTPNHTNHMTVEMTGCAMGQGYGRPVHGGFGWPVADGGWVC